jgi:hypothetical protein
MLALTHCEYAWARSVNAIYLDIWYLVHYDSANRAVKGIGMGAGSPARTRLAGVINLTPCTYFIYEILC